MITFKNDIQLTIVTGFDEKADNITDEQTETFKAGEPVDAEIVSEDGDYVDLQFASEGGVAFGVQRSCFDVKA
jgi:hypothetical protein